MMESQKEDIQPQEKEPNEELMLRVAEKADDITSQLVAFDQLAMQWKGASYRVDIPPAIHTTNSIEWHNPEITTSQDAKMKLEDLERQLIKTESTLRKDGVYANTPFEKDLRDRNQPLEIKGGGLVDKEGYELAFTSEQLKQSLEDTLPAPLLAGISEIRCVDSDSIPPYIIDQPSNEHSKDKINKIIQRRTEMVVAHEVFEGLVHDLTFDEMQSFEEAIQIDRDNTGISFVSKYAAETDKKYSYNNARKEDFCDSGKEFFYSPYELQLKAPQRFQAIMDIVSNRISQEQQQEMIQKITTKIDEKRQKILGKGMTEDEYRQQLTQYDKISTSSGGSKWFTVGTFTPESRDNTGRATGSIDIYAPAHYKIKER